MTEPLVLGYLSGAPRVSTRDGVGSPGPRTHVVHFLQAARALGWTVHPYIVGDMLPPERINGVVARSVGASWMRRAVGDVARAALSQYHGRRAFRQLAAQRLDVVYERLGAFQALGRPFRRRGIPWVLETNGLHWREADRDRASMALVGWARHAENAAYRDADLVVAVSEPLADAVAESAHLARERILVVPNGVDTTLFRPGARRPEDGVLEIIFVGTVLTWQSLDILLQAVAALRRQGITAVRVRVVGDGPALQDLRRLAADMDVPVEFLGSQPHAAIPAFIAHADLGFCGHRAFATGTMYASPLKLYEYGACGIPFVASDHPDARALAGTGGRGLLFTSGDVASLTRALAEAWECRAELAGWGAALARDIQARHTWEARVAGIGAVLQRFRS